MVSRRSLWDCISSTNPSTLRLASEAGGSSRSLSGSATESQGKLTAMPQGPRGEPAIASASKSGSEGIPGLHDRAITPDILSLSTTLVAPLHRCVLRGGATLASVAKPYPSLVCMPPTLRVHCIDFAAPCDR